MKYGNCEICGVYAPLQRHHLFSNSKMNRRMYGVSLDDERNIMYACNKCHIQPKGKLPKLTEVEFCFKLGLDPVSKTARAVFERIKEGGY